MLSPIFDVRHPQRVYFVLGTPLQSIPSEGADIKKVRWGLCDTDSTGGAATWRGTCDTHAIVDTVAAPGPTSFKNLFSDARRHLSNPVKLEGIWNVIGYWVSPAATDISTLWRHTHSMRHPISHMFTNEEGCTPNQRETYGIIGGVMRYQVHTNSPSDSAQPHNQRRRATREKG